MKLLRLATLALLGALSAPALAQDLTDDQIAQAMDFAMHDAIYTMYHESGHLLIHELGLPVLGKEEDAADALGAILIFRNTADGDELYNTMNNVADGWYFSAEETTGEGIDDLSFFDEHSLDIQRAYAMVCMMVGAAPDEFADTAGDYNMDADRQAQCADTYNQALQSWTTVLTPHFAEAPGAEIPVIYDDAGDYRAFADELKARHILEDDAEYLRASFALPGPVSIHAKQCGEANAFYNPDAHDIEYCYELAANVFNRAAANLFGPQDDTGDDAPADESSAQ